LSFADVLAILSGALTTIWMSAAGIAIGMPIGLGLALIRWARVPIAGPLVITYVSLLRATPLVTLVLLVFFAMPQIGVTLEPIQAGLLSLVLNTSAFNCEVWRASLLSFPKDQMEAAKSVGMGRVLRFRRIVLPHEGPNRRRRVALAATVRIYGKDFRVYSMHGETRIAMDKKVEQMNTLIQDLKRFPENMPVILVGDFNTWEGSAEGKTLKLFREAGLYTPFGSQSTFRARVLFVPIEFRLDWVWLRGVQAVTYGIDKKVSLSDHYPLWANVKVLSDKEAVRNTP